MRLAGPVDLAASLHGGQAFRWHREGDLFVGPIGGALVRFAPRGADVEATGAPRRTLERYLRIEPADRERRARLAQDRVLAPALAAMPGLRLLRQDPWETTVAFLTSANNNVLRIEGIVRALAAAFGDPIADASQPHSVFPPPERIARATEARLRALGLGYRAPFLRETARLVARGEVDLGALRGASREEAREALLALPGVGPKVADCIALFSLDVDGAFPIDRWVLRAVSEAFFGGREVKAREVEAFAQERWGEDAGLAQQFLFHAIRMRARAPGVARTA